MDKLLVIADDFTGALDTGIQFTKKGMPAKVISDHQYDFRNLDEDCNLLVINADSRPLSPKEAYKRVYGLAASGKKAGFQFVYKKTDSALRGNVGAELQAVMDAYEEKNLYFVPAFPKLNRVTRNGIHYIDGIEVAKSVFGKDPFEPVEQSKVAEWIGTWADASITEVDKGERAEIALQTDKQEIFVFDAETDEDLSDIANVLKKKTECRICAGCAGFASVYERMVCLPKKEGILPQETTGLFAFCGSLNPITQKQIMYAQNHGFYRVNMKREQKLSPTFLPSKEGEMWMEELFQKGRSNDRILVDSLDLLEEESTRDAWLRMGKDLEKLRFQIADTLGQIAAKMVEKGLTHTFSFTGGDTLMGFMRALGCLELEPILEIGKGAVLSRMIWNDKQIFVISKSGGFGEEDIFCQMYDVATKKD